MLNIKGFKIFKSHEIQCLKQDRQKASRNRRLEKLFEMNYSENIYTKQKNCQGEIRQNSKT